MRNREALDKAVAETLAAALGMERRSDPVLPGTGGPAGNAKLTAWTGLFLLVAFLAELVTLLDVRGLISWHLALGVLLIPPALLKTATTGWRIVRYYTRHPAYVDAGPPPLLLRLLGPLVVLSTLALLGTGLALVLVGQAGSYQTLFTVVGQRVDVLTFHQAAFAVWAVATGLHVLARTVPAWMLVRPPTPAVPGPRRRTGAFALVLAVAVVGVGWVLASSGGWCGEQVVRPDDDAILISSPAPASPLTFSHEFMGGFVRSLQHTSVMEVCGAAWGAGSAGGASSVLGGHPGGAESV